MTIMRSNWFREAIGEIDPSCSSITIHAGPGLTEQQRLIEEQRDSEMSRTGGRQSDTRKARERTGIFRIVAEGDFGTTEVC